MWHSWCNCDGDWGWRTQRMKMLERVQRYGRWLTTQQKNESDRRRLAHHPPSDLLCSLTRGWDRRRTAWPCLNHTSSFAISSNWTFHVLSMSQMMCAHVYLVPYSRNLLREKTFTNWWKITYSWRLLSLIVFVGTAKRCHASKFCGETLSNSNKISNLWEFSPSKVSTIIQYVTSHLTTLQATESWVGPEAK